MRADSRPAAPRRLAGTLARVLCAWAIASGPAAAAPPKLVVVPPGSQGEVPTGASARFAGLLADELGSREDSLVLLVPAAPAGGESAREAEQALARGEKLAAELEFAGAIDELRRGIGLAIEAPAAADFGRVVQAHVTLAVALFRRGDDRAAQLALAQAIRLDPKLSVPAGRYPPVFLRELEKARSRVEQGGHGQVIIDAPSGTRVSLDGRDLGPAPARAERVPSGVHYARIEAADGRRAAKEVEVGTAEVRIALGLPPASAAPVAAAVVTEALELRLHAHASEVGAELALWTVLVADPGDQLAAHALLYDARSRTFAALPPVRFGRDLATANVAALKIGDALVASLKRPGPALRPPIDLERPAPPREAPRAAVQPPAPVPPRPPPAALSREIPWWVWAVGASVVVGAAGTAAAVYANRPVTGTVTADW